MKKLSIILLALAFTLTMIVPALAIHIGSEGTTEGSLGITGTYKVDGQANDTDGVKDEFFDDDLEVVMKFVTGNVTAVIDWELADRTWGVTEAGVPNNTTAEAHANDTTLLDNYYVMWQATDALSFKIGEYAIGFGRKVAIYNEGGRNLGIMYGLDAVDLGLIHGKLSEGQDVDEDADVTEWALSANVKDAGPFSKLNFFYLLFQNEFVDEDDNYLGVDLAADFGGVALGFEYGAPGGDNGEGSFFVVEIGLEELIGFDLGVNVFLADEDYNGPFGGGDDYTPLNIWLDEYNSANQDTRSIWLTFGYPVNDNLSLSAKALVSAENDAGDDQGTEVDLGLKYKFADNVTYDASYSSYSEGDAGSGGGPDRTELFHRLTLTF